MISIIVPVYNVELYIHQCIDSILNQTYKDIEVLLVDDGSPDRCGEICDQYASIDSRVRVFHTENRGLSSARNLGLREAKGDYIGFVDSDDWIEPDMYEVLLVCLEGANADVSTCGLWHEKGEKVVVMQHESAIHEGVQSSIALIDEQINDAVWNKLYRRKLFQTISFPEESVFEDIIVTQQIMLQANKTINISDPKYHYRFREGSITKDYSIKNLIDYANACVSRFYFFHTQIPDIAKTREEELLHECAKGISRLWRWQFGCCPVERQKYANQIDQLFEFTQSFIPLIGHRTWPVYLRLSVLFMHWDSPYSLAILYYANQLYRRMCPDKSNVAI